MTEDYEKLKKDYKSLSRAFLIVSILTLVVCITVLVFMSMININFYKVPGKSFVLRPGEFPNIEINYENLTASEIKDIEGILSKVNPLYFNYQKSITFMRDICKDQPDCDYLGFNSNGKIKIQYTKNRSDLEVTICHELLHSFIYKPTSQKPYEDPMHAVVYAISEQKVCFSPIGEEYISSEE
jgi:hypothetical protein